MRSQFKYLLKPRLALSIFISIQICFEPILTHASPAKKNQVPEVTADDMYKEIDPIWQQFVDAKPVDLKLSFSPQDPGIDQDPFFMRTQKWNSLKNKNLKLAYLKTENALEIAVPETKKSVVLNLPLLPIQTTEEFIFLSLDAKSDLFKKASGLDVEPGEGIFFISRADLEMQAVEEKPVPVFFFPISGKGWTGNLSSLQIPQVDSIVIANKEESIAIELRDVETVMKVQKINLMIASALSAKNRSQLTKEMYPAAGMTAGFGMIFTGIDLQMPEKSMWPNMQNADLNFKNYWLAAVAEKISNWLPFEINVANAFDISPDVMHRIVYISSVLGIMLFASVVMKYKHPGIRKKIESLRESKEPVKGVIKNKIRDAGREIKESIDVFAAMTSTAAQVASVTFANSLELFLDRFAPTVAATEHSLLRRFLKNTFYFSRDSMKRVPVNSKTFALGAVVMGTVDTAMVGIQYAVAVPMIADAALAYANPDMQERIAKSFDTNSSNYKQIAIQDTARNAIAYIQGGASNYASESRAQVLDDITKEIESEMRAEGKDPDEPKYQSEKEERIEVKIDITMKQKGLAGRDQFLFDASTIFSKIPKALGYSTPESLQVKESFILQKRFGLSKNALVRAVKTASEWVKSDASETSREALLLLEETLKSMSFLSNGLSNGKKGIETAKLVRQQLTLLSYEGSIEYVIKYLPETWSQAYSPRAAVMAALLFRQSLYSYLSVEGVDLLFANEKSIKEYGERAKSKAFEDLKKEHNLVGKVELNAELQFELKVRTQIEINNLARQKVKTEKANAYSPPDLDWLEQRKRDHAMLKTNRKMNEYLQTIEGSNASDEQLQNFKQKIFTRELAKNNGLYIEDAEVAKAQGREDYIKMLDFVESKAQELTLSEAKNNLNVATYLDKLNDRAKSKMYLFMYANNFFQIYKEATTDLEMVKPTDPAQPGRFQWFRQTEVVRNNIFLTRALRTFEAFGNDQSMKLGWGGFVDRNLPFAHDLISTHTRALKTFLPMLSVSYLFSYYAWQMHMPYSAMVIFAASIPATIKTPSQWLNRVFRLNGLKAMDTVMSKIAYAIPYGWVTFAGMFPIMLYSGDVSALFSDYVRDPMMSVLSHVSLKDLMLTALSLGLITTIVKMKKTDLSKNARSIKNLIRQKNEIGIGLICSKIFQ